MLTNEDFFDKASGFYDQMVNFDEGINKRKQVLKNFILPSDKDAADIGCGTGIDSIALSQFGLNVTAFDISQEMIEKAKKNSQDHNCRINFHKSSIEDIPDNFAATFSFITSLGNTLANVHPEKMYKSLEKISKVLKENGRFLIQIINFKKILSDNERIINITQKDKNYFIRFYDFLPEKINFNILKFNKENPSDRSLITTTLFPYLKDDYLSLLKKTGFKRKNFYSNFNKEIFDELKSKDLIILAEK